MAEFRGTERFEVVRQIGAGGMGVVYEVRDRRDGGRLALKTLRQFEPQALFRFKNEFRALQGLQHPNLVGLGELFEADGDWFFTMELVEGVNFGRYVRQGGRCRVAQLRDALRQLATGLAELHAAGKVHRDIKPTNIQVTADGRVVLLDFGLLVDSVDSERSTQATVVGTAAYMAPEQAASKPVTAAADWYAVGVLLYEALTGALPFAGRPIEVLMDKQQHEPRPPRSLAPDAPPDLDALCAELLRFDPDERPTARQILERLGADEVALLAQGTSSQAGNAPPFVGRDRELAELERAAEATREGNPACVVVVGESGVGKSALIRRFADAAVGRQPDTVVLAGRCYEREQVPYKGFDGVIDALSSYLRRLSEREAAELVPRHASLLPRMFPVLGRVESIARAPAPAHALADPQLLRGRVFGALRELFSRLAERRPVIVLIDDLQWADAESLLLLSDLFRPPDPPPLALLASSRARLSMPFAADEIELAALEPGVARSLARRLLQRAHLTDVSSTAIANEARGHPLYIDELVRHALVNRGGPRRRVKLDEAIWGRVEALPAPARTLLALVAVAGAPLPLRVLRDAAPGSGSELARNVSLLRVANLVRGRTGRRGAGEDLLEPYHDRVREAVLDRLDAATQRDCHARLAFALEAAGAERERPELLLRHFEGAGELARAAACAEQAARRATIGLAFDRASDLFRAALRLGEHDGAARRGLLIELGDALASAGRGLEAAQTYLEAAEGAEPGVRLDCKRRATEHLLKTGHIERGLEAMIDVFGELGVRLPRTARRTVLAVAWNRARLRLRGYRWSERDESEIPPRDLILLDMLHGAARGLALVDFVRSAHLGTRAMLLALRLGERSRVLKELAFESMAQLSAGGAELERGKRLMDRIRAELQGSPDPYLRLLPLASDGIRDFYQGNFPRSVERVREAQNRLVEETAATSWEVNALRTFEVFALRRAGMLCELRRRADRHVRDAELRQDPFTATSIRCNSSIVWLARDDVAAARATLDGLDWQPLSGRIDLQQWWQLLSRLELAIYEGEDAAPTETFRDAFAELDRSLLARVLLPVAVESSFVWARAGLAAREPSLRDVHRGIRRLEKEPFRHTRAWVRALRAACSLREGDRPTAVVQLRGALDDAREAGMSLDGAAYRWWLSGLVEEEEGARLRGEAVAWAEQEEIAAPERLFRMVAPGLRPPLE